MPIGAAIGGAAVSAGGSALAASSQKKAANKATTAAQQTADQNNALQREIYAQNSSNLSPFMQRGNAAGGALNALLGLGGGQSSGGDWATYVNANPDVLRDWQTAHAGRPGDPLADINAYGQYHYGTYGQAEGRAGPSAPTSTDATTAAANAFDAFRGSTGYEFRLGEGQKSVLAGLGKSGFLDSGAAQKALVRYGQNFGSNEFGNYANLLQGQQGAGLTAASSLAGVGTAYAGAVGANNNSAGTAAANNALYAGSATASMYGGIASSLGNAFGQLGSSYGGSAALPGKFGVSSGSPWGAYSTPPIAGY